jgi:hypothetical protein
LHRTRQDPCVENLPRRVEISTEAVRNNTPLHSQDIRLWRLSHGKSSLAMV